MSTRGQQRREGHRARSLSLAAGAGALVAAIYGTPAVASASAAQIVVLWGDGVAGLLGQGLVGARFGQSEEKAVTALDAALGSTATPEPVKENGNCNIDATMRWPVLTGYFDQGHFVGYSTLSPAGHPFSSAHLSTLKGLRVGDTLAKARQIYGSTLRTSAAEGGSWSAKTIDGTLVGYLTTEVNQRSPAPRIMSIEAGAVGCPAMTP